MSNSAERSLVRSIALPAPPRIRTALRHPDAIEFDPAFTFAREAPYNFMMSSSCPSLPNVGNPRPASTSVLPSHDHPAPSLKERLERRVMSNDRSFREGLKIADFRSNQRKNTVKTMQLERVKRIQRLHNAEQERIERWTEKTKDNPFSVDQWAEDEKIYEIHQRNNKLAAERQQKRAAKIQASRGAQFAKAFSEVDELEILRKEKKKLVEHQKELKARMDLEKVNKRLAAAQQKQDLHKKGLERKLAKRGTLLRAHSDFFTDPLEDIKAVEEEEEEEDSALQARQSIIRAIGGEDAAAERGTSSDAAAERGTSSDAAAERSTSSRPQSGLKSMARTMAKVQAEIEADDAQRQTKLPESPKSPQSPQSPPSPQVKARATASLIKATRDGSLADIMAQLAKPGPPEKEADVAEESLSPAGSRSPTADGRSESAGHLAESTSPAGSRSPAADGRSESAGHLAESTSPAGSRSPTADGRSESAGLLAESTSPAGSRSPTADGRGESAGVLAESTSPVGSRSPTADGRSESAGILAESTSPAGGRSTSVDVADESAAATASRREGDDATAPVEAEQPISHAGAASTTHATSDSKAASVTTTAQLAAEEPTSPALLSENKDESYGVGSQVAASQPISPAAGETSRPMTSNSRAGSPGGYTKVAVPPIWDTSPAAVATSRPTSPAAVTKSRPTSPAAVTKSRPTSPAAVTKSRPTTANSRAGSAGASSPAAAAASRPTSPASVTKSRPTTSNSRAGSAGVSSPAAAASSRPISPAAAAKSRTPTSNSRAGSAGASSPTAVGTSRPTTSNSRTGSPGSPSSPGSPPLRVPSSRATSAGSRASAFKSGVGGQMLP